MSSQQAIRWGVYGALLAALAWTLSGVLAFVFPGSNMGEVGSLSWRMIETSDAVAEVGMMVALVGFHIRQRAGYGRSGAGAFGVAFLGTAFLFLSTIMWVLTETEGALLDILFSAGALGVLVGFPLFGLVTLRAGVLPRWCGWLLVGWLIYFPLIFYAVDFYGEARGLFGLVWLALAYALPAEREIRRLGQPALT